MAWIDCILHVVAVYTMAQEANGVASDEIDQNLIRDLLDFRLPAQPVSA